MLLFDLQLVRLSQAKSLARRNLSETIINNLIQSVEDHRVRQVLEGSHAWRQGSCSAWADHRDDFVPVLHHRSSTRVDSAQDIRSQRHVGTNITSKTQRSEVSVFSPCVPGCIRVHAPSSGNTIIRSIFFPNPEYVTAY